MGEILVQSTAVEFVLLILQLSFREDDQAIGVGLQALQGLLDLRQRGSRQVEQALAMAKQIGEFRC